MQPMSVRLILTSICCAALVLGVSYFIDGRLYWLAWAPFLTVAHEYAPSALSQLVSPPFAGRNKGLIFDEFPPTKFHDDLVSYIPRHIEVIVAVCQEGESTLWLADLCKMSSPTVSVHVYHKCNATHPGRHSSSAWRNPTWPEAPCIHHFWDRSHRGQEQEVYTDHILLNYARYQTTEPTETLHVFLQGDASNEVELPPFFHKPTFALKSLDDRIGYLSLSGKAWTTHVCQHKTVKVLRDRGEVPFVRCDTEYLMPSRASFVVSTSRLLSLQFSTWRELHALAMEQSYSHDPFEHTWAAIFGCFYLTKGKYNSSDASWARDNGGSVRKGLACYDRLK